MRSLHVWLLTGVLAAAACKPAVREASTLQSAEHERRESKIDQILIWSGGVATATILAIVGVKKKDALLHYPKKSAAFIKRVAGDLNQFIPYSNRVTRNQFSKVFPNKEWEKTFGLSYSARAKSAILEYLSVNTKTDAYKSAVDALKGGQKTADEVLGDDTLRYLNKKDLRKALNEIYPATEEMSTQQRTSIITKMLKTIDQSEVGNLSRLRKQLEKAVTKLDNVAEDAAATT